MTSQNFTRIAATLFGIFALIVAAAELPQAMSRADGSATDSIRFAMVAISAVAGALFLFARATTAMLRTIANSTGTGLLQFCCALIMPVPVTVSTLSEIVPYWLGLTLTGIFMVAFVFPGTAYRGLVPAASSALDMQTLGAMAKPLLHRNKWIKRIYSVAAFMIPLPFIFFLYGPRVIVSQTWQAQGEWLAVGFALAATGITLLPLFWVVPSAARAGTWPGLAVCAVVTGLVLTAAYQIMLLRSVPAIAAGFGGSGTVLTFPVLKVDPDNSGRFCSNSVWIGTDAGPVKLCNFLPEELEALALRKTLRISGKSTWMGQVARVIDAAD